MDSLNMINTKFPEDNLGMIETVELSIKRNLHGIRFGPSGPSKEERQAVINKLEMVAKKFDE